jgi:hypothetical protein
MSDFDVKKNACFVQLGQRILKQSFRARALADGDVTIWRKIMFQGCRHWFNNHPDCHRHCDSNCFFKKHFPLQYGLGVMSEDAEEADKNVPNSLRSISAESRSFRMVRDTDAIKYVMGIILIMEKRFVVSKGVKKGTTSRNEALHALMGRYADKRVFFGTNWIVWTEMAMLQYTVGPGRYRLDLYDSLGIEIGPGPRHDLLVLQREWEERHAERATKVAQKARYEQKKRARSTLTSLKRGTVASYKQGQIIMAQLRETFSHVDFSKIKAEEAGLLESCIHQMAVHGARINAAAAKKAAAPKK